MQTKGWALGLIVLFALVVFSGCVVESKKTAVNSNLITEKVDKDAIEKGDYVTLQYSGKLENGFIFNETNPGKSVVFQVGVGALIPGFDAGLIGMKAGEQKQLVIPPEQGYGLVLDEKFVEVDAKQLEDANIPINIGMSIQSSAGQGLIIDFNPDTNKVKIDFNPPLAGKTLIFDVNVISISNVP